MEDYRGLYLGQIISNGRFLGSNGPGTYRHSAANQEWDMDSDKDGIRVNNDSTFTELQVRILFYHCIADDPNEFRVLMDTISPLKNILVSK